MEIPIGKNCFGFGRVAFWQYENVAKYTNKISDSENLESLVIFGARTMHIASQSVQFQIK